MSTERKRVALVAHDGAKDALVAWARTRREALEAHELYATGTTGGRLMREVGLTLHSWLSGPLGGDAQLGAQIVEGRLDVLIFFIDPLSAQPHDVDVKALLRVATLFEVAVATNAATADYLVTSPHWNDAPPEARAAKLRA